MNNQDQAAEVIGDLFADAFLNHEGLGRDIARSLHEAGLLAPDLPEPDVRDTIDWWTRLASVLLNEDGERISIIFDNHWVDAPSPDHVRELALALLAAAQYTEEE